MQKLLRNITKILKELGIEVSQDEQFLEHFFSRHVEGVFSDLLSKILDVDITPWYEKECFFLSERDKLDLSIFASFQYCYEICWNVR